MHPVGLDRKGTVFGFERRCASFSSRGCGSSEGIAQQQVAHSLGHAAAAPRPKLATRLSCGRFLQASMSEPQPTSSPRNIADSDRPAQRTTRSRSSGSSRATTPRCSASASASSASSSPSSSLPSGSGTSLTLRARAQRRCKRSVTTRSSQSSIRVGLRGAEGEEGAVSRGCSACAWVWREGL